MSRRICTFASTNKPAANMSIKYRVTHLCILAFMVLLSTTLLSLRTQSKNLLSRIPYITVTQDLPEYNRTANFNIKILPQSLYSDALQTATAVVTLLVGVCALIFTIVAWPNRKEVCISNNPTLSHLLTRSRHIEFLHAKDIRLLISSITCSVWRLWCWYSSSTVIPLASM
jgi:hypothetical protein